MIKIEMNANNETVEILPSKIKIPSSGLSENLQHVEQNCQFTIPYDAGLLSFLLRNNVINAVVKDDSNALFTGQIAVDTSWTDNGEEGLIESFDLSISDNTRLFDKKTENEVALIHTNLSAVIQKICLDCGVEIESVANLPTTEVPAFVLDAGKSYLESLNTLLYEYGYAFGFNENGELKIFDIATEPTQLSLIGENELFAGVSLQKVKKTYDSVKVTYANLVHRTDEQVYFEGNDLNSDNEIVPITIRPNQYYPYESDPAQEARAGQVFQTFEAGYAESYTLYSGEKKYRRTNKTQLVYTENHRIVEDWEGNLTINRTAFGARQASVRLFNQSSSDVNLYQLAIRADAYYRSENIFLSLGSGSSPYESETEFIFAQAVAERFASMLSRFVMGGNLKISANLENQVYPGRAYFIDTGATALTTTAICISCNYDPENEKYEASFLTYGEASIDIHRRRERGICQKTYSYDQLKGEKGDQGEPGTAAKFVEIEADSGLVFKNGSPSQLPLKCIATGFTASAYQWYKDGTAIPGATSQTYNATNAGVYKVTANGYSDIATVISVSDGADGNDGTSPYACSVSNENFTVATGTDLKPLSVTTYSVKFTAYKGSSQLSAIAPSATIASGKFKVSTPTATGFEVAQSTNGTITFKTATITAISENLSVNVTVTYDNGSTETKTITISASKTGATGTSSYSYVRYSANADGSNFVSTPTASTKYIGVYTGSSSTAPTEKTSYTWSKYVGNDGGNGTSTRYTTASVTSSTTSIALSTLTGSTAIVGDMIIGNSLLFAVTAISGSNATVAYKQSLKGEDNKTISVIVSAPNVDVPSASDGSSPTLSSTSTTVRVYQNTTELAYDGAGISNGTWKMTVAVSGCTGTSITDSGTYATLENITAMSANSATRTMTITGKRNDGTSFTTTVTQTLSKNKQGPTGTAASQIGENLLHDSKLLGSVYGSTYPYYKAIDNGTHTANALNGFTQTYCNNSSGSSIKDFLDWKNIKGFTLGDKYTLSFWAKGSGKMYTYWYGETGYVTVKRTASSDGQSAGSFGDGSTTFTLTSEWKQYWVTYQLNSTGDNTKSKYILFRAYAGAQIYIAGPKFEKGSVATAWVPHVDEQNISVSSTAITYQQSTSGTTVPTGTWSSTPPTATAGQYMWTRTIVTYSNGNTSTSYSVSKNGTNGGQGTRAIRYLGKYNSWQASKAYVVGDVVINNGDRKRYTCKTAHTSGSTFSATNWTVNETYISGDWYFALTDGKMYLAGSSTFTADTMAATNYRVLDAIQDVIAFVGDTSNSSKAGYSSCQTLANSYAEALVAGTVLADKIFTNNITIDISNNKYGWIKTSTYQEETADRDLLIQVNDVVYPINGFKLESLLSDNTLVSKISARLLKCMYFTGLYANCNTLWSKKILISGDTSGLDLDNCDFSKINNLYINKVHTTSGTTNNKETVAKIPCVPSQGQGGFYCYNQAKGINDPSASHFGYERIDGIMYIGGINDTLYKGDINNRKKFLTEDDIWVE